MTKDKIANAIKYGKTLEEIFDAWNSLSRNKQLMYDTLPIVEETLRNLVAGKDPRFTKQEVNNYITQNHK